MGRNTVPERWEDYKPIGKRIEGTRFIAFKVPLRSHICETVNNIGARLDISRILEAIPNLGLVIDLTNTYRYYDPADFSRNGIQHTKLMVPGREIPPPYLRDKFQQVVRNFLERNKHNDKLIGVHCTHGVNRTGFFICHHMVTDLAMEPKDAVRRFELARGHSIERQNYLAMLYNIRNRSSSPYNMIREERTGLPLRRSSKDKDKIFENRPPRRSSRNEEITHDSRRTFRRNSPFSESDRSPVRRTSGNAKERTDRIFEKRSDYRPPCRPSRNEEITHDNLRTFRRTSPFSESDRLPVRRTSDNAEIPSNNPFRRDPLWNTSALKRNADRKSPPKDRAISNFPSRRLSSTERNRNSAPNIESKNNSRDPLRQDFSSRNTGYNRSITHQSSHEDDKTNYRKGTLNREFSPQNSRVSHFSPRRPSGNKRQTTERRDERNFRHSKNDNYRSNRSDFRSSEERRSRNSGDHNNSRNNLLRNDRNTKESSSKQWRRKSNNGDNSSSPNKNKNWRDRS